MKSAMKLHDQSSPQSEFKVLLDQYAAHLHEAEIRTKPYRSSELPHFSALSHAQQQQALHDVKFALEVIEAMIKEGQSLKDSPKYLWRTLKHLGLTPCSDIFSRITDGDVVIIYSTEHKQLFQNLRFFELVTLTIEDLYCTEWYKCTQRPEWAMMELYQAGNSVFTGKIQNTFDPGVKEHLAEEVNSDGGPPVRLSVKVKWMSPVKKDDQVAGVIVVNTSIPQN